MKSQVRSSESGWRMELSHQVGHDYTQLARSYHTLQAQILNYMLCLLVLLIGVAHNLSSAWRYLICQLLPYQLLYAMQGGIFEAIKAM